MGFWSEDYPNQIYNREGVAPSHHTVVRGWKGSAREIDLYAYDHESIPYDSLSSGRLGDPVVYNASGRPAISVYENLNGTRAVVIDDSLGEDAIDLAKDCYWIVAPDSEITGPTVMRNMGDKLVLDYQFVFVKTFMTDHYMREKGDESAFIVDFRRIKSLNKQQLKEFARRAVKVHSDSYVELRCYHNGDYESLGSWIFSAED